MSLQDTKMEIVFYGGVEWLAFACASTALLYASKDSATFESWKKGKVSYRSWLVIWGTTSPYL